MRSDYGLTAAGARFVAGKARGLAQAWPADPFAQSTLAEAEYDDNDYSASEAAADRALASDPSHFQAIIYKGRAEMALAKSDPAKANWGEIRGWFAKANHIDTENAEPLMLYYQSFVLEGEQPTTSAVKGLMYALVLAPQDQKLRWMAVRQLLLDGKFDDARRTLGPIAFDPHADSERARADKVLTAIESQDSEAGVTLIDAFERDWKHV
jgi:tetratricopeptide (TPR) repeat protein